MRKLSALLGLILAGSSLLSIEAQAASPKTGLRCSKLNQTVTSSGFTYTCMKVGKKLVWSKGVKIPAPMPSPSASPTISQNPTLSPKPSLAPTPTPTSAFTPPAIPTSFQDLVAHVDGIKYGAWLKTREQLKSGGSILGTVRILIGPNTSPEQPDPLSMLGLTSKLFSDFKQVKNLYLIEFNNQDMQWAQSQYEIHQDQKWRSNYSSKASEQCPTSICNNASSELNNEGDGIILLGVNSVMDKTQAQKYNPGKSNGTVESHEYVHTIQNLNSSNAESQFRYSILPPWLQEGQAMWAAQGVVGDTFEKYLKLRAIDYSELATMSPSYTPEWISTFLNPNPTLIENADNWAYWRQWPQYRVYDIGGLVNEILASIKGPLAVMNIYSDVGSGSTFTDSFKKEFGIAWSEALPFISTAIAAELSRGITS